MSLLLELAASAVVYDLEQPRTPEMPMHPSHQPGYAYHLHRRHEDDYRPEEKGPRGGASGVIVCKEHAGTHIDALCHQSEHLTMHNGVRVGPRVQTSRGFLQHGVEEIPPLVAPGLLLDVPRLFGEDALEPGYAVTEADLRACCERQGVSIRAGEIVLVRTGNARFWGDPERYLKGPGMTAGGSRWVAEQRPLAVGADNMAWDVIGLYDEEIGSDLPGHLILLVRHGIYILENLDLEALAASGHSRFLFICAPLKLVGATGSPVRPLALVTDEEGKEETT
ncbi:MAG: cyclase family protein [Armatimonadetes bacterium]|nr:cyclase family protein [Armatimonadota bacterium]